MVSSFLYFAFHKNLAVTLSLEKWYSRERAMLPLSICEIKFWGNSNCEFLRLKTFTVLAWFTTFELAVVLMNTSENLDSIWNSGLNSPLFRQFKHQKWFHSGNFSKGKAISLCESELWTSWLQHFPYVRICLLLSYFYSYHLCTKRL